MIIIPNHDYVDDDASSDQVFNNFRPDGIYTCAYKNSNVSAFACKHAYKQNLPCLFFLPLFLLNGDVTKHY